MNAYNPWDDVGARYPDWVVRIRDLRGPREMLCVERRVIIVTVGESVAERRCSLAHAVSHLDLDHLPSDAGTFERRQEADADQLAARRLITLEALVDAVTWTTDPGEACAEMNVDLDTLRCRADHLHPSERAAVRHALAAREEGVL